jgi:dsRNA-specific ribonuclease
MSVTSMQTAQTVQVHTTVSATVGTQVMEEIAQVLNIPKALNHSQLLCNITHSYSVI